METTATNGEQPGYCCSISVLARLLQVRSFGNPCYIGSAEHEIQDFRGFQNGGNPVTQQRGNPKTNRKRVSDLAAPPAPRSPQQNVRSQTGIPTSGQIRTDRAASGAIPSPHLLLPKSTVPPASTPSRLDYQRSLAELLTRPKAEWQNRDSCQEAIGKSILFASKAMESRNFQRIAKQDLERMAEAYDSQFFKGLCLPLARSYGMSFRLSSRMTRAGGKTTRTVFRGTRSKPSRTQYEIALSTSLLFQSFRKPGDSIRVCGHKCNDRLTAMQRIVEHEMIHLSEMLAWIQSDCSASRFQSIACNMFGHTEHRHELITQQERAAKEFNIRAGARVAFPYEGTILQGVVNRITRRATILVEDLRGVRYSNGKRYLKYYVPIHQLRPID